MCSGGNQSWVRGPACGSGDFQLPENRTFSGVMRNTATMRLEWIREERFWAKTTDWEDRSSFAKFRWHHSY